MFKKQLSAKYIYIFMSSIHNTVCHCAALLRITMSSKQPDRSIELKKIIHQIYACYHLLGAIHRDDSNKWSSIELGEEISQI